MEKKLIIVSGSDRVGKSTFIKKLKLCLGDTRFKQSMEDVHFSAPDVKDPHIFSMYYDQLNSFINDSEVRLNIWDRSYVCGYILERIRRNTHKHHSELLDLEFYLMEQGIQTLHIGIMPEWSEVAERHFKEVKLFHDGVSAKWFQRDVLETRRIEHNRYNELLAEYYSQVTAFKQKVIHNTPDNSFIRSIAGHIATIL